MDAVPDSLQEGAALTLKVVLRIRIGECHKSCDYQVGDFGLLGLMNKALLIRSHVPGNCASCTAMINLTQSLQLC